MKQILFLFIGIACTLASCSKDDDVVFDAKVEDAIISFEAIAGGAIMKYELPSNSDIYTIQAKYEDFKGKEMKIRGTYLNTELELIGFIDEESEIPVEISFLDKKGNESETVMMTFSTLKSATFSFFDDLEVLTYWAGFKLKYNAPEQIDGIVHIGKIGVNEYTNKLDTLIIETLPIAKGENTLFYSDVSNDENNTTDVVIWTEDFRGNVVRKEVYMGVEAAIDGLMDNSNFVFTGNSSYRHDFAGPEYLFDGDTKGIDKIATGLTNSDPYCWTSDYGDVPGAWQIDLGEKKVLSKVRLYCPLSSDATWPLWHFNGYYGPAPYCMPNHVKIYGTNDPNLPLEDCDLLGENFQSVSTPDESKWCLAGFNPIQKYNSVEEMSQADPCFWQFNFDLSEQTYRYVKIEVLSVFKGVNEHDEIQNDGGAVVLQEIEVFVKVD